MRLRRCIPHVFGFARPFEAARLHGIPRAAERRHVVEIESPNGFDSHAVEKRRREDVDALGHLRAVDADQLRAQQAAGARVPGHAEVHGRRARVIGLVVPRGGTGRPRLEAVPARLRVSKPCPGDDHLENLDRLGAEAPRELGAPTDRVFAGHVPVLVGATDDDELLHAGHPQQPPDSLVADASSTRGTQQPPAIGSFCTTAASPLTTKISHELPSGSSTHTLSCSA